MSKSTLAKITLLTSSILIFLLAAWPSTKSNICRKFQVHDAIAFLSEEDLKSKGFELAKRITKDLGLKDNLLTELTYQEIKYIRNVSDFLEDKTKTEVKNEIKRKIKSFKIPDANEFKILKDYVKIYADIQNILLKKNFRHKFC